MTPGATPCPETAPITAAPVSDRPHKRPRVELRLGDADRLTVSVARAPYVSVLGLLADAVGGMRRGVPEPWRRAVASTVDVTARAAVHPIVHPGASVAPDCISLTPRTDITVEHQLEFLRDAPAEALLDDLDQAFGSDVPEHWLRVAERPRHWLKGYARAGDEAWRAFEPIWRSGRHLVDREIERVGTAMVRGTLDALLANLHSRLSFRDGSLCMDDPEPAAFDLAGRRLVLVPTMGTTHSMVANFDLPDVVWIAYPVTGMGTLRYGAPAAEPQPSENALELLLGTQREQLVRLLARGWYTGGGLAASLNCAPSSITYHCGRLMAAGVVARERRGREVRFSLTDRGRALLELLS